MPETKTRGHRRLTLEEERGARDFNGAHEIAFRAHQDWFALLGGLLHSFEYPVPDQVTPYPGDMHFVPTWILDACYTLILDRAESSSGKGRHARWTTQQSQRIRDQNCWRVTEFCRANGITSPEERIELTAAYLGKSVGAVTKAINRIRAMKRRLAAEAPGFGETLDPVFELTPPYVEQDRRFWLLKASLEDGWVSPEHFAAFVHAAAKRGATRESRFLESVQQAATRRRRRRPPQK